MQLVRNGAHWSLNPEQEMSKSERTSVLSSSPLFYGQGSRSTETISISLKVPRAVPGAESGPGPQSSGSQLY